MKKPENKTGEKTTSRILLQERSLEYQLSLKDRALAAAAEGITIADATKPDCPLIYVNRGFEDLTGYSAEFVCGTNCRFLQGEDTDPTAVEEIRRAVRERRECVVEILNYRKTGEPFWNRLSITPIHDDSGVVTHFIGIQSDVTARRKAEDAQRAATAKLEAANNLIQRDLQLAAEIQKSFLPRRSPDLPGANVAWELLPCDELAGDTLNVTGIDDRHIVFYVVDVSGHGVQAALLSVTLNRWLSPKPGQSGGPASTSGRPADWHPLSPVEVLDQLNKQFPFDPKTGQYFTIAYGVLDTKTNEFRFASAGHPAPVYVRSGDAPVLIPSSNFPIGIVPEPEFRECTIEMKPGDRIYLYSDGLVDATNDRDERFEDQRLLRELGAVQAASLKASVPALISRLRAWSGNETFQDDVSLLGFEIV